MNWQRLTPGPLTVALLSVYLVAACASNPPATGTVNITQPEPAAASEPDANDTAVIEAVPAVAAASDESAGAFPAEPALVCSYERRTGSHRRTKICRRPQTALDEDNTQRTFESLRRSQMQVGEPK